MVPLIDDSAPAAQCGGFIQFNSALFVLTFVTLETVSGLETRRGGYVGGGLQPGKRGREGEIRQKGGSTDICVTDCLTDPSQGSRSTLPPAHSSQSSRAANGNAAHNERL